MVVWRGGDERSGVVALADRARRRQPDPQVERVVDLVCAEYRVSAASLMQASRGQAEIAQARQVAMYLCYVVLGRKHATIARLFGRDRSTASYACARIEDMRDDQAFDDQLSRLEQAIAAEEPDQPVEAIRAAG